MGEITEALRRAKVERERRTKVQAAAEAALRQADRAPEGAASARAGAAADLTVGWDAPARAEAAPAEPEIQKIATSREDTWAARAVVADPRGIAAERFRHFALRFRRAIDRRGARSAAVTSPLREEGKTTTSCNLALALASLAAGRRVALVELDMRRPSLARNLGLTPRVGIEHVLEAGAPLATARIVTDVPHFEVFAVARPSPKAHELLASPRLAAVLAELERRYDTVVVDTPPVLLVPDTTLISAHVGAVVMVVRAGKTRQEAFTEALACLPEEKLAGVFLNEAATSRHRKQYGYYYADEGAPVPVGGDA